MSFIESYEFISKATDPVLGQIELWRKYEDNEQAFGISLSADYPIDLLKERSMWQHQGVIELLAAELQQSSNQSKQIVVYYEYFEDTLLDQIIHRKQQKLLFPETEIWFVFEQLVDALSFLSQNNKSHGELKPASIYYNNSGGIKIFEKSVYPIQLTLQEMINDSPYTTYFAPELFLIDQNDFRFNSEANDVFCLGLVILEMCTSDSPLVIYDHIVFNFIGLYSQNRKIDQEHLETILRNMSYKYSFFLVKLVREMLRVNKRPTLEDIYIVLQPFKDRIREKQAFTPRKDEVLLAMGSPISQRQQIQHTTYSSNQKLLASPQVNSSRPKNPAEIQAMVLQAINSSNEVLRNLQT